MNKGFRSLTERVVESLLEVSPFFATNVGAHAYDHLLDRHDADARSARRAQMKDALRELKTFENAQLTHTEEVDLSVLAGTLQSLLRVEDDVKPFERDPGAYMEGLIGALFTMVVRDYGTPEERARCLLERLRAMPGYLDTAVKNLKLGYDLPRVWTEVAITQLDTADLLFRESLLPFAKKSGKIADELSDAVEGTRRMLLKFRSFLSDDLLPRCDGSFAVGRDFVEYLLDKTHGLHLKAKEVMAIGEEEIAATRTALEKAAADLAPGKRPTEILAEARKNHPPAEKLLAAYRKEFERAREFIVKKDLFTLPEDERLTVIDTPAAARALVPVAASMVPAPFETKQESLFFVTVPDRVSGEKHAEMLQSHALPLIAITAVHEGYPGHHLQLVQSNHAGSKVRRVLSTSTFAEGWALYCEDLLLEEGFFQDPRSRVQILADRLRRACWVVIDAKLQLQMMQVAEAIDMLVNVAGEARASAESEVRRYTLRPTQAMSHILGRREIGKLRDEYRQQRGERWSPKEFHDKLLSFGTIPPSLVRDAMLR